MPLTPSGARPSPLRPLALALLLAAACAPPLAGCAGKGTPPIASLSAHDPLYGAPAWALGDCHAFFGADGARLCGVGAMAGTRNVSLARTAAIGRARVSIGRTLEAKLVAMLNEHAATPEGAEIAARPDREQYLRDVARQISDAALPSTTLDDSWVGQDGTLYTLVSLDADHFEDALARIAGLSEPLRAAVQSRARASFAQR